jgi:ABC-type antimicrobial peptide transport system permease subunit
MSVVPDLPFDFAFLNEHLGGLYRSEQSFLLLFRLFAAIAITIACLGLYGLISQDIVFKVKEIGIRKVLGASSQGLTLLLLRNFLIIVVLSNVVAWPIGWKLMSNWLSEFSYQQPMNLLLFPLAGCLILLIAVATVGFKTLGAANANPVKSLRSE